jgi:hypothetical protein
MMGLFCLDKMTVENRDANRQEPVLELTVLLYIKKKDLHDSSLSQVL